MLDSISWATKMVSFVLIGAAAILAMTMAASAENLLINASFEDVVAVEPAVDDFGYWGWDPAEIVAAENSIVPSDGAHMLRFDYASGYGATYYHASEVIQLVDLSSFSEVVVQGDAIALATAYVNRVLGDAETDTRFGVNLYAFTGSPADFDTDGVNELARQGSTGILSDSRAPSWELVTVQMTLPTNTDYLAVMVYADENIMNDESGIEFDGHYCDLVSLEIIPEPATLSLLALGLGALFVRRRRRA